MATESFFSNASLAYLASAGAGKDGKTYSIKPTDGTGDFTFSRGSNLAATRVGPTGLIEKGRENLVLYSNKFDEVYWSKNQGCSIVGQTATDPFGVTNNAWVVSFDGTTNGRLEKALSDSSIKTMSIWVRTQSGTQDVQIGFGSAELVTKTITTTWQRIEKFTPTGNLYPRLRCDDAVTLEVFGFQVELGLAATDYIESGASTGKAGLLEDEPRFDYSGGATCPSLLLEPQRVNVMAQSEYLVGGISPDGVTLTHNHGTSPEGVQNSVLLTQTGGSATNSLFNFNLPQVIGDYSYSFFIKAGTSTLCRLYQRADNVSTTEDFNPQTISAGETGGALNLNFESYGNDWWRVSFTKSVTTTNAHWFIFYPDRTNSGNNVEVYGFQWEAGSYPTSYIPNHSGGSATRTADLIQKLNQSSVIGQTEGTIFFDAFFKENDKVNFSLSDSTSSNHLTIDTTGANSVFGRVVASGTIQAEINTSGGFFTNGDRLKCALAYKENDFAFYINGAQIGTDTSGSVPVCDDIRFSRYNGSLSAYQSVNQVLLFDTRLSNADLETLTT